MRGSGSSLSAFARGDEPGHFSKPLGSVVVRIALSRASENAFCVACIPTHPLSLPGNERNECNVCNESSDRRPPEETRRCPSCGRTTTRGLCSERDGS